MFRLVGLGHLRFDVERFERVTRQDPGPEVFLDYTELEDYREWRHLEAYKQLCGSAVTFHFLFFIFLLFTV